jgi:5'-nucleotidase
MKRACIVTLFLLLAACATQPAPPEHVVIVGTTDVHGWFNGHPNDKPAYGGLALLASNVDALRAANEGHVIVVDSGDMFQGTLESNLFEGEPVVKAYNQIGYAAAAVGNHEFDFGPAGPDSVVRTPGQDPLGALKRNAQLATYPFLSANMVVKATGQSPAWAKKSIIVNVDGARIGIIGLSTPDTPNVTTGSNVESLDFLDPVPATVSEARRLRAEGADAVIVIAHMGGRCTDMNDVNDVASCEPNHEAVRLVQALPAGTIDAYFAGHTHSQMRQYIAGTPVVQSLAYSNSFSTLDLWIDRGAHRVTKSEIRPHTMLCTQVFVGTQTCDAHQAPKGVTQLEARVFEGRTIAPQPQVAATLDPYLKQVAAKRNEKTGITTTAKISRSYEHEAPLGDILADAMREAAKADIAVINSGGIRNDLRAGELTYSDIFEVSPFDNYLAVVEMTGAQITEAIRITSNGERGILQVSGLKYTIDQTKDAALKPEQRNRASALTLANGQPLDPNAIYRVAMPDFLASGGDGLMPVISQIPKERITWDWSRPLRELFIDVISKWPMPLTGKADGRISVIEPAK